MCFTKRVVVCAVAIVAALCISAPAEIISSSSFSLGYGLDLAGGPGSEWSTNETSGSNTPTDQGDFTFSPTVGGDKLSGGGPQFDNRVLADGGVTDTSDSRSGWSGNFTVSIYGEWDGATPADAAPDPDYHIRLNITSLKIWAAADMNQSPGSIAFHEATTGHEDTSSYTDVLSVGTWAGMFDADMYRQLTWDPADYQTSGTSFTRSFDLAINDYCPIVDGFEVEGTVDLTYTLIPEPSTLVLLAAGGVALIAIAISRRRKRSKV